MRLTNEETSKFIHNKLEKIRDKMKDKSVSAIEENEKYDLYYEKLGQLEDIEEELGVDLITLFKCKIGKKVFVKRGNEIVEMVIDGMEYLFDHIVEIAGTFVKAHIVPKYKPNTIYTARVYSLYTKDYGKTWALTKEELL